MISTLEALRDARILIRDLDAQVRNLEAPHLAAAEAVSFEARADLAAACALEAELASDAAVRYAEAMSARRVSLLAGHETPMPGVPAGCVVQCRPVVSIAAPDEIPRALCAPNKTLVAAALKQGAVPGARLTERFVFVFRTQDDSSCAPARGKAR